MSEKKMNKISSIEDLKDAINLAVGEVTWLAEELDKIEGFRDLITFLTRSEIENFMKSNGYEEERIDFKSNLQKEQNFLNKVEKAYFAAIQINHKPLLGFLENLNTSTSNKEVLLQEGLKHLEDFYRSTKVAVKRSDFFNEFNTSDVVVMVENEARQRMQYLSGFVENFVARNAYEKLRKDYSLEEDAEQVNESLKAIDYLEGLNDSAIKNFEISEFLQPLRENLSDILDLKKSSDSDISLIKKDLELFTKKSSKKNPEDFLAAARINIRSDALKARWRKTGEYGSEFHLGSAAQLVARIIKSDLEIKGANNESALEKSDAKNALNKALSDKKDEITKLIASYIKLTQQENLQELDLAKIKEESLKAVEGFEKISKKMGSALEILHRVQEAKENIDATNKREFSNQETVVLEFVEKELFNNGKPIADNLVNLAKMVDDFELKAEKSKFATARSSLRSPNPSPKKPVAAKLNSIVLRQTRHN